MTPILLGKHPELDHWFFFGVKGGVGRFIRYYVCKTDQYAQWASAEQLPGILDITSRPSEDIINEVDRFSKGFVSYEIIPKVRGRAERVIRTELSGDIIENRTNEHVLSNSTNVERDDSSIKARRRARTKSDVSERATKSKTVRDGKSLKSSDTEKIKIRKKDQVNPVEQNKDSVNVVKVKPKKSKPETDIVSKKLAATKAAAVEEKPKRKRRTKAEMEAFRESIIKSETKTTTPKRRSSRKSST